MDVLVFLIRNKDEIRSGAGVASRAPLKLVVREPHMTIDITMTATVIHTMTATVIHTIPTGNIIPTWTVTASPHQARPSIVLSPSTVLHP